MLAGMDRKVDLLARLPLFSRLDQRSMEAVATLAREVAAPAGTVLMREGDPAESFYLIVEGTVHVQRAGNPVRSMTNGGFLGEIALVERIEAAVARRPHSGENPGPDRSARGAPG